MGMSSTDYDPSSYGLRILFRFFLYSCMIKIQNEWIDFLATLMQNVVLRAPAIY